jgi:hypothetical protein
MISLRHAAVYNAPIAEMSCSSTGSFTGCGKSRRGRKSEPQALKRCHILKDLTARLKLCPSQKHESEFFRCLFSRSLLMLLAFLLVVFPNVLAADWSAAEQELARKIVAVTGPGAVSLEVTNRSSLGKKDSDEISRGLRAQLEGLGARTVKPEQAAATVSVSLSENLQSYVWVAEIHQGAGEFSVVMTSTARGDAATFVREAPPLTIRRIALWAQEEPILDVAVLEESAAGPSHIAVLDPEKIALYRLAESRWQPEQSLPITHSRPWPRDVRGRLVPRQDHLFDIYLPGMFCQSASSALLSLVCRPSDDPWPLSGQFALSGFFAATRNFFTGVLSPGIGKQTSTTKFYSAAPLPRPSYTLWLFAGVDGTVRLLDGITEQNARFNWGSDLASIKTSCGSGWQVLATRAGDNSGDAVRAFEFPDRDPLAVSPALEFSGGITALWTEAKGGSAIAVSRNAETGTYEAFRLAVACSQ